MRTNKLARNYIDGIAFGVFLTAIAFLVLFLFIDIGLTSESRIGFLGNIFVAIFSLAAALIALGGIQSQISHASKIEAERRLHTDNIEEERRHNSLTAAKAFLPSMLSTLSSIAINNLRLDFGPGPTIIGNQLPVAEAYIPLPTDIIPAFKECIQHAEQPSQQRLSNILSHFQVSDARQTSLTTETIQENIQLNETNMDTHNAIKLTIGWAVVHALVNEAFHYARSGKVEIPPAVDPANVRSAFVQAQIYLENYPNVEAILQDRIDGNRLEHDWDQN